MSQKNKIGLVLGGGGARGLAHIGVLKVLEKNNIKPDFIVGTSIGAFIGALYALGIPMDEIENEAKSINKRKAASKLIDISFSKGSFLSGIKAKKYVEQFVGRVTFTSTNIPLYISTTDLGSGEEVVIKSGSIADAVMASMSVPGIFPPVRVGERLLVDGGVINPTPINIAKKLKAKKIIAVDFMVQRGFKMDKPNVISILLQSYEIMRGRAVEGNFQKKDKDVIILQPDIRGTIDSFKFYDIEKYIASGERVTRKALSKIKKLL